MGDAKTKTPGAAVPLTAEAYTQYALKLNRYLVTRVRRSEDASDLCQEIFELYIRRHRTPAAIQNPLAYLFRIAFTVVSHSLSKQNRDPVTFDSEILEGPAFESSRRKDSTDHAEDLAVQEDIERALASLPESHLAALMLVEGEGLSYEEAARRTGFTRGTIANYVMWGRAAFSLALDGVKKAKDSAYIPQIRGMITREFPGPRSTAEGPQGNAEHIADLGFVNATS